MSCRLADTSRRMLEIIVLSCEGLRIGQRPVRKNTCVVVRSDPVTYRSTSVDLDGGSHPYWNEKLSLEIPIHERFLTLEVHCNTRGAVKVVGSARMPISDFTGGYLPENYLNFLSYRLRDGKGERNGIVNVSVRVKPPDSGKEKGCQNVEEKFGSSGSSPVTVATVADRDYFDGVVTGIPVNWKEDLELVDSRNSAVNKGNSSEIRSPM